MKTIVIYEGARDTGLFSLAESCLSAYGRVLSIHGGNAEGDNSADFLLLGLKDPQKLLLPDGLLLFECGFSSGTGTCPISNLTPIIEYDDRRAATFLKGRALKTVTVGTCGKATLSIASLSEGQASLSLQRKIRTLDGNELEPCDFQLRHNGSLPPQTLLLMAAVLLVSGIPGGYDLRFLPKIQDPHKT